MAETKQEVYDSSDSDSEIIDHKPDNVIDDLSMIMKRSKTRKKNLNFSQIDIMSDVKIKFVEQMNKYYIFAIKNYDDLNPKYQDYINEIECFKIYNHKDGSNEYQFRTKNVMVNDYEKKKFFARIKISKYNGIHYISAVLKNNKTNAFDE